MSSLEIDFSVFVTQSSNFGYALCLDLEHFVSTAMC